MSALVPAFAGSTNNNVALLATSAVLTLVSTIVYLLRAIVSSTNKRGKIRADFIWITFATVLNLILFAFIIKAIYYGMGQHMGKLDLNQLEELTKWTFFAVLMQLLVACCAKLSIAALLISVQILSRTRQFILWGVAVLQTVVSLVFLVRLLTNCAPLSLTWDILQPGKCLSLHERNNWTIAQGYRYATLILWAVVETNAVIILGTVPTLRPLFVRLFGKAKSHKYSSLGPSRRLTYDNFGHTILLNGVDPLGIHYPKDKDNDAGDQRIISVARVDFAPI
ncbi:hypothetical protein ANO11243_094040 [Dothideomycetidae sp. 11243]|nr:hypothetical protein ANO11243_094040 [fungal sp. No.11243]